MSILESIERREISEALHFTKNSGLSGTIHSRATKSRQLLEIDKELKYIFEPNANFRKDRQWLNYVNLSITDINSEFFRVSSCSWHAGCGSWWCILSFSPRILTHDGVFFTTTNNIYSGVSRALGETGLEAMFAPQVQRWSGNVAVRPDGLASNLTTCEQAEVLYPEQLSTDYLQRIYVRTEEDADDVNGLLEIYGQKPELIVLPEKFQGAVR